jgi:hypothetical protein
LIVRRPTCHGARKDEPPLTSDPGFFRGGWVISATGMRLVAVRLLVVVRPLTSTSHLPCCRPHPAPIDVRSARRVVPGIRGCELKVEPSKWPGGGSWPSAQTGQCNCTILPGGWHVAFARA